MSFTLLGTVLKRVNKGGTVDKATGVRKGTDYIVFNCPNERCGKRQKTALYLAEYKTPENRCGFKCKFCGVMAELSLPVSDRKIPLIISPGEYNNNQSMLRRAMGR